MVAFIQADMLVMCTCVCLHIYLSTSSCTHISVTSIWYWSCSSNACNPNGVFFFFKLPTTQCTLLKKKKNYFIFHIVSVPKYKYMWLLWTVYALYSHISLFMHLAQTVHISFLKRQKRPNHNENSRKKIIAKKHLNERNNNQRYMCFESARVVVEKSRYTCIANSIWVDELKKHTAPNRLPHRKQKTKIIIACVCIIIIINVVVVVIVIIRGR